MKILFVVHRFLPHAGGSEYYVYNMAKSLRNRGYDVSIMVNPDPTVPGEKYVYQGLDVWTTERVLFEDWDAIIVHGSDVWAQDIVHINRAYIKSKIVYMLIKPSYSAAAKAGMIGADIITYSTAKDIDHIEQYGFLNKARRVRHGIDTFEVEEYISNVPNQPYYVSAGGFWIHKGFHDLARAWNRPETLYLYGYGEKQLAGKDTEKVKWLYNYAQWAVMVAIGGSSGYILNSYEEGFGLVILEAMVLKVPVFARKGVGAVPDLADYLIQYDDENDLMNKLQTCVITDEFKQKAHDFVVSNHSIYNTVDDLEDILNELK